MTLGVTTLLDLQTKHKDFFEMLDSITGNDDDTPTPIQKDAAVIRSCHGFFSDLINKDIITNTEVKKLASSMVLKNPGTSVPVTNTPVVSWLFAILRIAKKLR